MSNTAKTPQFVTKPGATAHAKRPRAWPAPHKFVTAFVGAMLVAVTGPVLLAAASGTAGAASGLNFLTGRSNVATTVTSLSNSRGSALALNSKGGMAPFSVNQPVQIPRLNASYVGGKTAAQLAGARGSTGAVGQTGPGGPQGAVGARGPAGTSATGAAINLTYACDNVNQAPYTLVTGPYYALELQCNYSIVVANGQPTNHYSFNLYLQETGVAGGGAQFATSVVYQSIDGGRGSTPMSKGNGLSGGGGSYPLSFAYDVTSGIYAGQWSADYPSSVASLNYSVGIGSNGLAVSVGSYWYPLN